MPAIWNTWCRSLGLHAAAGLGPLLGSGRARGPGILAYHRIAESVAGQPAPTYNVDPKQFRRQLEGLLNRGYRPWALQDLLRCAEQGDRLPSRVFVVTFDDGYECLYSRAFPVLRQLRVPATIFLATAYLDHPGPFPFDDWAAAGSTQVPQEAWRPLRAWQCKAMLDSGLIELGAHTHTHGDFRGQPDRMEAEVRTSLDVLRSRFGVRQAGFAYPFGAVDPDLTEAVCRAGATCGLTTANDLVAPSADRFAWGRLTPLQSDTPRMLAAALEGWYETLRVGWRGLLRRPGRSASG